MRILVCDDEPTVLDSVADYLGLHGIDADSATSGAMAMASVSRESYDVIVLDVMMPRMSGLECCRQLRSRGVVTPILFLTARDSLEDTLAGFEAGGDDYLVKPFAFEELVARLRALSSRFSRHGAARMTIGDLTIDLTTGEATRAGAVLDLSPIQFRLLKQLALRSPTVVTRTELERTLWGDDVPDSDSLRVHVSALRRIVDKPVGTHMIRTVHGVGFRLVDDSAE